MRRKKLIMTVGIVCLALVISVLPFMASCAKPAPPPSPAPSPPPTPEAAAPAVSEWDIPFICTLTGPVAAWGLDAAWGVEFAVRQINDAGGIRGVPIKLTEYDTSYDPAKAVAAMTRIVEDRLVIIGPWDEIEALAAGDIAVEEGVFFFCPPADPERIWGKFSPWATTVTTFYRVVYTDGPKEWLKQNPDIKTVVVILSPDDTAQLTYLEYLEETFESAGIELLGTVEIPVATLDLGPATIKALDYNADGYVSVIMSELAAKLMTEFSKRGMTELRRILSGGACSGPAFFDLPKEYIDGMYMVDTINTFHESAGWQALVEAYAADHDGGYPWFPPIVFHYDVPYIIKAAFEDLEITGDPAKLAEERVRIKDYINSLEDFEGLQYRFDMASGGIKVPTFLFQMRNGRPVVVASIPPE